MNPFPVSSSVLSSAHLATFVADNYGFSANTTCHLLKTGINHTYAIDNGSEKYIFRVYSFNWRTIEEINEEIRLLLHLKKQLHPISFPIADKHGDYIQQLAAPEGNRLAVLFSHAGGEKVLNFSNETHFDIGKIMAGFHKSTQNFTLQRINYTPDTLLIHSLELIRERLSHETEEIKYLESAQTVLMEALKNADTTQLRSGVVHLDIWFDNLNINKQGQVTLFDFNFCGNGWQAIDIAYYLMQLYFLEPEKEYESKKESFLEGYKSITSISEEEKRLLPVLGTCLYFYYLGVQCYRFENWSNTFINEVYLKRYIAVRVKKQFELVQQNRSLV
ncbi:MAG: phosphotransferase [Agriterribacter sp.]